MASKKRKVLIVVCALVGLFLVELGREWVVYIYRLKSYQASYWKVEKEISKKEVREIVGAPDAVEITDAEYWHWQAEVHQGYLWRKLRLHRQKEFYQLVVQFDENGLVSEVYSFGH